MSSELVAWRFTSKVDFSDFDRAMAALTTANAFADATEAEREGMRLVMPG